jgi:hypothetical protein
MGRDPDGLDDALTRHARALAGALHRGGRRGLEEAENELVAGEVERSAEARLGSLPGFASGSGDGEPELLLRQAGPVALVNAPVVADGPLIGDLKALYNQNDLSLGA